MHRLRATVVWTLLLGTLTVALAGGGIVYTIYARMDSYSGALTGRMAYFEQAKLAALAGLCGDHFGYAVAMDADTAIVGAYGVDPVDTGAGSDTGSAYVFIRSGDTWAQQAVLISSDLESFNLSGSSVAISGNTALIGVPYTDSGGEVYVFVRDGETWSQQAKLTGQDVRSGDQFGASLAINGDTLLAGAPLHDDTGTDSGAVYAFTRSGTIWTQQQQLNLASNHPGDRFGSAVALDGDIALIGARFGDQSPLNDTGLAYIYTRSGITWSQQAKLKAQDAAPGDDFGYAVALRGNTALIGAPGNDSSGNGAGAAYIFAFDGIEWNQQAKLNTLAGAHHAAGFAVTLAGDLAVIGAPGDDAAGGHAGAAYVYLFNGVNWALFQKLTGRDTGADDQFGISVASGATDIVAGADFNGSSGNETGAVYLFAVDENAPTPTMIPSPGEEQLLNGSFEEDSNSDKIPDDWTAKNRSSDSRKCNKPGKIIAFEGDCVYQFKGGAGENSKLQQDVAPAGGSGAVLYLSGFISASGNVNFKVKVKIAYTDDALPTDKLIAKFKSPASSSGYFPLSGTLSLALHGTPAGIKVLMSNKSASGKVRLDLMSLTLDSTLALPGSSLSGRQSN